MRTCSLRTLRSIEKFSNLSSHGLGGNKTNVGYVGQRHCRHVFFHALESFQSRDKHTFVLRMSWMLFLLQFVQ